jgi:multiple antibiotic resistance protein
VTGHLVFLVFNVTVAAFKIAGGILLIDVAFGMFHPTKQEYSSETRKDISVIPLAFPLTSGPGAITTVILLVSQAGNVFESSFVFIGIIIGIAITYVAMVYSDRLFQKLGYQGLDVITALMSIIVMAIAVQFIISGITAAIPSIPGMVSSA